MSDMIKRVAQALAKEEGYAYDSIPYDARARAAIKAMREPTDAMCDAADWQQQSEVNQYQRAIDAALGTIDA